MALRVTDIIRSLDSHLTRPVILAEQSSPKPSYPYIAIKEIVSFIPTGGRPSNYDEDLVEDINRVSTSQPTMSLSLTAYGNDFDNTSGLIQQAHDWFTFTGYRQLKEAGYVVAEIQSVMNRDSLIVDDYERKRGFDVILRFVHTQSRVVEEIKVVKGTINNKPFKKEVTIID